MALSLGLPRPGVTRHRFQTASGMSRQASLLGAFGPISPVAFFPEITASFPAVVWCVRSEIPVCRDPNLPPNLSTAEDSRRASRRAPEQRLLIQCDRMLALEPPGGRFSPGKLSAGCRESRPCPCRTIRQDTLPPSRLPWTDFLFAMARSAAGKRQATD